MSKDEIIKIGKLQIVSQEPAQEPTPDDFDVTDIAFDKGSEAGKLDTYMVEDAEKLRDDLITQYYRCQPGSAEDLVNCWFQGNHLRDITENRTGWLNTQYFDIKYRFRLIELLNEFPDPSVPVQDRISEMEMRWQEGFIQGLLGRGIDIRAEAQTIMQQEAEQKKRREEEEYWSPDEVSDFATGSLERK